MAVMIVSGVFGLILWSLAAAGLAALALGALIGTPVRQPPELMSVATAARALDRSDICCESLPTIAFAVAPDSKPIPASTYSFRLKRNFGASGGYRDDLAATGKPLSVFAGASDELMFPDKYTDAVGLYVPVRLIYGVNPMGIVSDPVAVAAIAGDVAKTGSGS